MSVRVYKLGGPALEDPDLLGPLAAELRAHTKDVVLVHGGGRHVERMLRSLGVESTFVDGRRATSPAAMEVVEMVLSGVVNKSLAAGLSRAGVRALGLSGRDGGLIRARPVPQLGRVGIPEAVDGAVIRSLWSAGFVPVVAPVSSGPDGQSLNVNADEAALALAAALSAESLVYLSDVDGVSDGGGVLENVTSEEAALLIASGVVSGGMALKVRLALQAAAAGIPEVVIAGKARLSGGFGGTRILSTPARATSTASPVACLQNDTVSSR